MLVNIFYTVYIKIVSCVLLLRILTTAIMIFYTVYIKIVSCVLLLRILTTAIMIFSVVFNVTPCSLIEVLATFLMNMLPP